MPVKRRWFRGGQHVLRGRPAAGLLRSEVRGVYADFPVFDATTRSLKKKVLGKAGGAVGTGAKVCRAGLRPRRRDGSEVASHADELLLELCTTAIRMRGPVPEVLAADQGSLHIRDAGLMRRHCFDHA